MTRLARLLFYGYVLTLIVAGLWGAVFAARDIRLISGVETGRLPVDQGAALLSQYRFLRAIELGFGVFALVYRERVFADRSVNLAFLTIMGLGIAARALGFLVEGHPDPFMVFFAAYEAVAIVVIAIVTRPARAAARGRADPSSVR